jgi:hypothetical protein
VASAGSGWDPAAESSASESDGSVTASVGTQSISFRGSAPAYRRNGTLTFVRDGALRLLLLGSGCLRLREPVQFVREDLIDRCSRVLLRPGDLRRLALLHPSAPADPSLLRQVTVKAHAWLDDAQLVLIVALDVLAAGRFGQVVVVGGRRAIAVVPVSGGRLSALRASPRGRYLTVRAEDPDAVLLRPRRPCARTPVPDPRARPLLVARRALDSRRHRGRRGDLADDGAEPTGAPPGNPRRRPCVAPQLAR